MLRSAFGPVLLIALAALAACATASRRFLLAGDTSRPDKAYARVCAVAKAEGLECTRLEFAVVRLHPWSEVHFVATRGGYEMIVLVDDKVVTGERIDRELEDARLAGEALWKRANN